ncbi:MAG TPA: extracellular solute-binding protein [Candidatus Limiplasma sp.]|nr:extracellular solute-binding protein [Candidatus Limiplasma sp.]
MISILLCLTLVLSCFSMTALAADEKTSLTVWVPENLRIEDWKTNNMTQILEEEGNFDLNFVTLPSGSDYVTKVNMALTAGNVEDLPDVILALNGKFTDSQVWEWAQAGTIIPLTEYYNDPDVAVNINAAIARTGSDYPKQITSPDGNIYGIATLNQSYGNEYLDKMWYSKTWLAALGAEEPQTTEEFYELLKKVHETDLNGDGKADEIGLTGTFTEGSLYYGWFAYLMNAFVYAGDKQYRTVTDGTVGLAYMTDEWKEGLKYIRKMFEEGLIASETLTMDDEQFKALMNSEEQVVFAMDYAAPDMLAADGDRVTEYMYLAPLTGPEGTQYASYTKSVANITFLVTANCKDPEAAFRLGDLMSSELMGITQRWGTEGEEWDYIANVEGAENYAASVSSFPISIVTYHDGLFWGGSELTNGSWRQTGPYVRQYGIACGVGIDPSKTEPYTIILNGAWDLYQQGNYAPAQTIPKMIYTSEESDLISEIQSNLRSYVKEMTAAFLIGNEDIDAGWDDFQAELENIGASTYLEIQQTVYDRMYK